VPRCERVVDRVVVETVTFASGMPVFDLPNGYAANPARASIADDVWTPSPPTLPLVALGRCWCSSL
jgi:hypothetical protein